MQSSVLAAIVFPGLLIGVGAWMRWRALPLARRNHRNGFLRLVHGEPSVEGLERWYRTTGVIYIVAGLSTALWGALLILGVVPTLPNAKRLTIG